MDKMENRIKSILLWGVALLISVSPCFAEDLCAKNEKVIISFSTKVRKNLSICKETKNNYLVYRYGRGKKVEMQYPHVLDNTSWDAFTFSGRGRAGGKENAGFGDYDLTFSVDGFGYTVFQAWNDEDESYQVGIVVRNAKTERETRIEGLSDTQKGSLVLLDEEKNYIQNTAQ